MRQYDRAALAAAGREIREQLGGLLGPEASSVSGELGVLLAQLDAGADVVDEIIALLQRFETTQRWLAEWLAEHSVSPPELPPRRPRSLRHARAMDRSTPRSEAGAGDLQEARGPEAVVAEEPALEPAFQAEPTREGAYRTSWAAGAGAMRSTNGDEAVAGGASADGGHAPTDRDGASDAPAQRQRRVRRDASASFPSEVEAGSIHPLRFLIGGRLADGVSGEISLEVPIGVAAVPVVITVHAPAFQIVKPAGPASGGSPFVELTLQVDGSDSSVEGEFLLRARPTDATRETAIQVDIWYRYLQVGHLKLQTRILPRVRGERARAAGVVPAPSSGSGSIHLSANAPVGGDVTLQIREEGDGVYFIAAHTARVVGLELGTFPAGQNAWIYSSTLFDRFREAAALPAAARLDRVVGLGIDLWKNLPKAFHDFYWTELAGKDLSIAIYSEEPYIPWELIRPPNEGGRTPGFLGIDFRVARWRNGRPFPDPLEVADFVVIAPTYAPPLEETAREADDLVNRFGARVVDGMYDPVKASLISPDIHVFHFAGHGAYVDQRPMESQIQLSDIHLYPSDIETFRQGLQPGPFVFLNACEVGERGWAFTGIGGWADTFCDVHCTGFLGPYWKVNDAVARQAAVRFYASLAAGQTVAEAARTVRRAFEEPGPLHHHPSWLAYSLHCPPNIHVTLHDNG